MLALKQWKVEYVYRYSNRSWTGDDYSESTDVAIVIADSEEEAARLVTEAGKTGAFDWAQHQFVGLRMLGSPQHAHTLVLSDYAIKMIQDHIPGSYIERKEVDSDWELPLGRDE